MEDESDSHPRCPQCPPADSDQEIPDVDDVWIGCDACDNWFHCACVHVEDAEDIEIWYCSTCISADPNLIIKNKPEPRKSKRSKVKHDYAAINDGIASSYLHVERLPSLQIQDYQFKHLKGDELTLDWLDNDPSSMSEPIIVPNPTGLDMKMPPSHITIDQIADIVGKDKPVEVIDCATQHLSKFPWTLGQWAAHYYKRREAPEVEKTLNVISLEVSDTDFASHIIPPKFVRDLDWVGNFWPKDKAKDAPHFAGSSVFYHVLRGQKTFYLARPNSYNLQQYKMWSESADQGSQWFGDLADATYTVTLKQGNTLIIPTGWMHAVYTPEDSLVIGGNFVHSYGIEGQQKIVQIEIDTKVPLKFRFPGYQTLCWYVANHYTKVLKEGKKLPERVIRNLVVLGEFLGGLAFRMDSPMNENGVTDEKAVKIAKTYSERFPHDDIEDKPFELAAWLKLRAETLLKYKAFNESLSKKNLKRRRSQNQPNKEEEEEGRWTEPATKKESTSVQRKCKRPFINEQGEWVGDMSKPENDDASTPVTTRTPSIKPPRSAPRRSSIIQTPRPTSNGNVSTNSRRSSIVNQRIGSQRTPSVSTKPQLAERPQRAESSRSQSQSSFDFEEEESPSHSSVPLPQDLSEESESLDSKPASRLPLTRSPSTPVSVPLNHTIHLNQNNPVSPSPTTRTLEKTVSKRDYEECKAKLRVTEQYREKELIKLRELESQMDQVEQFNMMKPKLQAKIAEMQTEIKDLRVNGKDLQSQNEKLEQQHQEVSDLLEIATLDKELAEEKTEHAVTELENVQEREVDLETEVENLKFKLEEEQENQFPASKTQNGEISPLVNKQLEKQNDRLKMALIRLRDVTNENETLQKQKINELQFEIRDLKEMQDNYQDIRSKLQDSELYIDDLKQQLDDSLASADVVEHLTDSNLSLNEQVESMRTTIEELEALKELSDELEESHNDTEKQMQELLDYKDLQLLASLKRISGLLETTADYENTILQFREHMQLLQSDLDEMRQTQLQQATESEALTSQSQAMLSLNQKLQTTAHKSQAKAIDLDLKKLDAAQASEHLKIVQNYLPTTFFESGDADSANCLLFFQRCAFKSDIINQVIAQMHGLPNSLYDSVPEILVGVCELRSKLTHFAAINRRFAAMVRRCSVDMYLRMGKIANEIKGSEKKIDHWIELLRREEFREFECTKDIIMLLGQFEHLVELYLGETKLDLDEKELDFVLAIDCDLDSTAAAIGLSKQMMIGINNDQSVDKEIGHYEFGRDFFEPVQNVLNTIKSIKYTSRKFASRVENCIRESSAIEPKVSNQLSVLSDQTVKLNNFAVSFAQDLSIYMNNAKETNEPFEFSKMLAFVNDASQALGRKESHCGGGWTKVNDFVDAFAETINDVLQASLEPDSVVKLISEEPWLVRIEEFKSITAHNVEAERAVNKLTNDVKELVREIRNKDQTLQESSVKIEVMSKKLDTVKKQTEVLESMEDEVSRLKKQEKTLSDALDVLQTDLNNVEQENDKLKQSAAKTDQAPGHNAQISSAALDGLGGNEGSLEKSGLIERIDSLMSVVKYLRSENAYLKSKDNLIALKSLEPLPTMRSATPSLVTDDESDSDSGSERSSTLSPPTPTPNGLNNQGRSITYQLVDHLASKRVVDLTRLKPGQTWQKSESKPEYQLSKSHHESKRLIKKAETFLRDTQSYRYH
ncbi:hypothetical protein E3P92_00578 [Wallemia ichthyophaga]|nr:hypothetical protein E3P98_02610 [Wallemia ichthyophaga]TIA99166.1 hypothetical protein E3P95_02142 [Wallemia ichthyophaga]TIB04562.1 hypothetical protein E3P94_00524 [Wallemia ichthyophaga]TIB18415.1 hypothetical protein E3P92_00578 [Wallemia ichthyophaga]TIB35631.1 hypothetical protein E3P84_01281 [Wallemia ichthyophaga]